MKRQPTKLTRKPHLWIHRLVWRDRRLNSSSKVVYGTLADFVNNDTQLCFPSMDTLSVICHLHEDTIRSSLKKLEKYGYINIERKEGEVNNYELLEPQENKYNSTPRKNQPPENSTDTPRKEALLPPENLPSNNTYINNTNLTIAANAANDNFTNHFIGLFAELNPAYQTLFGNNTQRKAVAELLKIYNEQKLEEIMQCLKKHRRDKFCPAITTPKQLLDKIGSLKIFFERGTK